MRKSAKYFLSIAAVFLATGLITGLFFIRPVYRALLADGSGWAASVAGFIDKLTEQKPEPVAVVKTEDTIRILEGWTLTDIAQYFERSGRWTSDEFLAAAGRPGNNREKGAKTAAPADFSSAYSFLSDKPEDNSLEGYLFPDTYRIYASSTIVETISKMLDNFDRKLTPKMREDIKSQGRTIHDVVILASIIEKEAPIDYQSGDNRDARIIAGIFLNRLKSGQGLQSDATLSYIYDDNKPAHSGAELEIDSPYNTYRYRGLPPGPICNPGIVAIEAAIYPISTDYNYFLTPKGKEKVVYAETYEEHLQNKYKYLR